MDSKMEIVDGHMHLWTPETHPWLDKVRHGGHPAGKFDPIMTYLVDDYLADIAGYNVSHCVHIQANMPDPVEETKWLDAIAESGNGMPHAIVGYCDLSCSWVEDILTQHKTASKRVRGIRQMLNYHGDIPEHCEVSHDKYLTDPNWIQAYGLLEKHQLSYDLQVLPWQFKRAADVVRQHPSVQCVVGHCGFPYFRDEPTMKIWREGLQELSRYPNVYCKASGTGMFAIDPTWDRSTMDMIIRFLFEIFGHDRMMFSSNLPVDNLNSSFPQLIEAYRDLVKPFTLEEQNKFFAENSKTFYRL